MSDEGVRSYNPALDGIRAVAVISVLLYHGGATTGGFFGVDVFFVLSGFLICGLLLHELRESGRISLSRFWARRARRLIPAMLLVALFVVLALPFLLDELSESLRLDVLSALTYTSNWWFIANGRAYSDPVPSPVLHTWSLAIEEQWYLVFPLVLLGLGLCFQRRLGAWLGPLLLTGAGVSAAWTAWLASQGASFDRLYFGTDTRVQGLLVGASLAAFLTRPAQHGGGPGPESVRPSRLRGALGWLGFAGIITLVLGSTLTAAWLPLGGFLLVAVLSGMLVASVAPSPARWSPAPILSWKPLVAIGLISYGLYLWHFPVYLWLTPERTGLEGWVLLTLRLLVSVAAATASYLLVEVPIRRGSGWASGPTSWRRVGLVGAAAGAVLIVGVVRLPQEPAPDSLVALQGLASGQSASPSPTAPGPPTDDDGSLQGGESEQRGRSQEPTAAGPAGNAQAMQRVDSVLLVGDSVALSLLPAARAAGGPVVNIATRFGCGTVPFTAVVEGIRLEPEQPLCDEWERARAGEIGAQAADLGVLILGPWELYDRWLEGESIPVDSEAWLRLSADSYRHVLEEMAPHVEQLVAVPNFCRGAPDVGLPVETMYRSGRYAPVVNDEYRMRRTNDALALAISEMSEGVQVIDLGPFLCEGGYREQIDGITLHTDGVHFTEKGGELVWRHLVREMRIPT